LIDTDSSNNYFISRCYKCAVAIAGDRAADVPYCS